VTDEPVVAVLGEPLLELSSDESLDRATGFALSFSGDALNAAAAVAAAGVRAELVSRVGEDEMAARLLAYARELGVGTDGVRRGPEPTGAYLVGADPDGRRDFVYLRSGSAAAAMRPDDLAGTATEYAAVLVTSGIAMASSSTMGATVLAAARQVHDRGGLVVHDPNFRRRLSTPEEARENLAALAPYLSLVVPSAPADTSALVDTADAATAIERMRGLGCRRVLVTCGSEGALMSDPDDGPPRHVPAVPAQEVVDSTGAGDVFLGTLAAGLARSPLDEDLIRRAHAAAALSLGARGGTGRLAGYDDVEALARRQA